MSLALPTHSAGLALPSASGSGSGSGARKNAREKETFKRLRAKRAAKLAQSRANMSKELDEGDDVDDKDLEADAGAASGGGNGDGDGDREDEGEDEEEEGRVGEDMGEKIKRRRKETYMLRQLLDEEQGRRYDAFTVTTLPKAAVNRLNRDLLDQHLNANLTALVGGMGKVFIAEIVELAKDIQEERGDRGPLTPLHLKLARERLGDRGLKMRKVV